MMNGAHHHRTFVKQNKIIKTTSFTTSFSSCSSSSSFVLLRGAKSSSNTKKKKTTKKDVLSTFTCRIHDRGGERVSRRLSSSSCHSCSFSAASSSKDDDDSVDYEPPPLPPRNKGGVVTRKSKGEEDEEEDNNEENNIGPRLIQSIATATIGAFLFGYHSAVINAPLASIASDLGFAESDGLKGVVVSVMVLGGVLGGFSIAPFADKYGRKNALAFVTIPLAVGALISAVSWDAASMTFGRLITGIGVGASSQIVPLYLAEISPPSFRGTANGLRRMAYVFGCLAAFQLAVPLEEAANGGDGWWRPLFSDSVFPAVALAVTALVVAVESPVWLLATSEEIECEVEKKEIERESRRSLGALMNIRGKAAKVWQENIQKKEESSSSNSSSSSTSSSIAANSNNSSSNSESAAEENTTVEDDDRKETSSSISWSSTVGNSTSAVTSGGGGKKLETWSEIFKDETNVPSLITGVGLCALAAFSGSNTVIFYAKSVFSSVGLSSPELLTWAVGVPNIVGGVLALVFTDKLGRRPLLLWSFGGMSACLVALSAVDIYTHGVPFLSENNGGFGGGASSMTTSSKFFKASFCNTLDPSAVEVLSPEQKAKQRGSLSINEGYFSDIFNVQQSSYSSFTTKSIICEDLPDREIGGLIEDVAIQGRDTKSNNSGERQEPEATIALISLPLYVLFFSAGAGPVPWLLYNEVFPTRIRAKAVSLCTATNYFSNAIVGSAFLPGVTFLGLGGTYAGYALLNLLGYVFVKELVFETKGMKLEDIEETMLEKWAKNKNATS
jgi:MFS family permease|tara:strand:+ start:5156 stop:7510 length:2355 start_codon:yes stop_codon:yes gene_type:complete